MDKQLILNKIKEYYKFQKDSQFAKFLGIPAQNLSKWKNRNTYDAELIYTKCTHINPEWLLTGQGEMLKSAGSTTVVQENSTLDYKELADARKETIELLRKDNSRLEQENAQLKAKLSGYESQESARVAG
ncbi:helix-turn-helix domain-containing protein [Flavobacterium covae]|uniref:helix-turn-helix domain-containing protein n=1 Tax=Flavobacterium covae TaxID=2906076 RepID=UPI000745AFB1|nr:helix-turn-helix domain-containing protein [Flavobacterium covae]AMA49444.1 hypothetical protein AWN65_08225 [Flavobacterium covae]MCJ1808949.1 helix-turn-helix domain-containing protein [Flavobacterium covae]